MTEFAFYFLVFSFLGWVLEVGFHMWRMHRFVNRGYDNGPVCPIYGLGIAGIHAILGLFDGNFFVLIAVAFLLPSLLELVTGVALDLLFHTKWWDYSGEKYNLGGYICLKFSLAWGALSVFSVLVLFPAVDALIAVIPEKPLTIVLSVLMLIFFIDLFISTLAAIGVGTELRILKKTAALYRTGSDAIGKGVCTGTAKVEEEYEKLVRKTNVFRRRILDAFPNMKSRENEEELTTLREALVRSRAEARERRRAAKEAKRTERNEKKQK